MNSDRRRTTIKDIAETLHLSVSTVSRALQGNPRISKETTEKVKKMALSLDYSIHGPDAALRTGQGNNIGVIVPRINRQFFSSLIGGIEQVLRTNALNTFIYQTQESFENEQQGVQAMLNAGVDGLMISLSIETQAFDHIERFIRSGRPVVFFDRCMEDSSLSCVMIDDFNAAYQMTEHVLANGCKKLVYLGGSEHLMMYRNRRKGFEQALLDHHIQPSDVHIYENSLTREKGYDITRQLIETGQTPDAIVSASDFSALGSILCLKEAGINIPEQVCVTGFANELFSEVMDPSLTTVEQHAREIGMKAAEIMVRNIKGFSEIETVLIPTELIIRKSSLRHR